MSKAKSLRLVAGLFAFALAAFTATPARAQMAEVKKKAPMYGYVLFWAIPRAQWGEMQKAKAADEPILKKALADGILVAYGNDQNLVHQPDADTHDDWWAATSMAGLLNVLDQFYKSGAATSPVLASATKHWDMVFVSRYYNWHAGTWKDACTHGAAYKLKAGAPDDAVDVLSKNLIVPLLEKQLADGTIFEYAIDTEAIHTDSPGTFWIFYLTPNGEEIDKANAAVGASLKANPLAGPVFGSMVDFTPHRDFLARTNATYK